MEKRENLDILDITKFILSFMVVGIHTLGKFGIYPMFRIAVPLFFMISSYLFFSKEKLNSKELKKFCIRNIKLYVFWFIVLLPVFITEGEYLKGKILFNIFKLAVRIIFGSSFAASWFIMALVIGTVLIFCLRKIKIDIRIILILTFIIYALCCLNSNYRNLFEADSIILLFNNLYPGTIYNGFPVSLFWISLGYYLAFRRKDYHKSKSILGLIISSVLLFVEYRMVNIFEFTVDNDCYFMLIPTGYFLFEIILKCNYKERNTKILRKFSTIIYCIHGSWVVVIEHYIIKDMSFSNCFLKFVIVVILSLLIACLICIL